jgi:hypothetical protein
MQISSTVMIDRVVVVKVVVIFELLRLLVVVVVFIEEYVDLFRVFVKTEAAIVVGKIIIPQK